MIWLLAAWEEQWLLISPSLWRPNFVTEAHNSLLNEWLIVGVYLLLQVQCCSISWFNQKLTWMNAFLSSVLPCFIVNKHVSNHSIWWLWTGSTPIRELRITAVVGGCFVADSAQLLEPHHIHHIPQTDRRGWVPVEGEGCWGGWLGWAGGDCDGCFFYVCV